MASNPNPTRISPACWWFWEQFDAHEPTVLLGGVFANKPGYHNYRLALPSYDYSVGQVSTDRADNGQYASAIDLSMPPAQMKLYSQRLHTAMAAHDARLYIGGQAILREYIGTLNGTAVSCYVLLGGQALGLAGDSGADWGRDASHLWHIHLSVIRKFVNNQEAWKRILSILKGQTAAAYFASAAPATPPQKGTPMALELHTPIGGDTGHPPRRLDEHFQDLQNLRGYLVGEKHKAAQMPAGSPVRALEEIAELRKEVKELRTLITTIHDLLTAARPTQ